MENSGRLGDLEPGRTRRKEVAPGVSLGTSKLVSFGAC